MLSEFLPNEIWLVDYPVRYAGTKFNARMTVIRLSDGRLFLHSPCNISGELRDEISALGDVACIVAPGSFHHLHVASARDAFPSAETYICPGIERKRPELAFDWILGDKAPVAWGGQLDQVLVRGTKYIWEVAFLHRRSRTLILVDLIELFTDDTEGLNWMVRLWWKGIFRAWNRATAAPEYRLGWGNKALVANSLGRILAWDFDRVIISHGDLIESSAKEILKTAWKVPLRAA